MNSDERQELGCRMELAAPEGTRDTLLEDSEELLRCCTVSQEVGPIAQAIYSSGSQVHQPSLVHFQHINNGPISSPGMHFGYEMPRDNFLADLL